MLKKIVLFLMIFFFLFALADFALAKKCKEDRDCYPPNVKLPDEPARTIRCIPPGNGECVRALEITYPKIINVELTQEKVVEEGLPGYVKYVFTLAVSLIGFIIFGVLIYNGILYLTSTGEPSKMKDAKDGIFYAFLGGILLLSSALIFQTINPQLKIMELPSVEPIEQVIIPGIYICNYPVNKDDLEKNLKNYVSEKGEKQIEAAKELKKIMWNPETKQACLIVNFSGNFKNFNVNEITKDTTIFVVPSISIDQHTGERKIEYQYGIILHEKDNFSGKCDYFPKKDGKFVYDQVAGYSAEGSKLTTARSVTLIQKPLEDLTGEGVTLYSCLNYDKEVLSENGIKKCGKIEFKSATFKPEKFFTSVTSNNLEDKGLDNNTRSIKISGPYVALLFEKDEFNERCTVLYKDYPNLFDILPTEGCITGFFSFFNPVNWFKDCKPLLKSIIFIRGNVL